MLDRLIAKLNTKLSEADRASLEVRYTQDTIAISISGTEQFNGDIEGAIAFASSYQPIETTPKKRGKDGRFAPKIHNAVGDRVVRMDS